MKPRVFIALPTFSEYNDAPLTLLRKSTFDYLLNMLGRRLTGEEVVKLGANCIGIVAGLEPYDEQVLTRMPALRCISRCGVGTDNICLTSAEKVGIVVRNTPEVVTAPVPN